MDRGYVIDVLPDTHSMYLGIAQKRVLTASLEHANNNSTRTKYTQQPSSPAPGAIYVSVNDRFGVDPEG